MFRPPRCQCDLGVQFFDIRGLLTIICVRDPDETRGVTAPISGAVSLAHLGPSTVRQAPGRQFHQTPATRKLAEAIHQRAGCSGFKGEGLHGAGVMISGTHVAPDWKYPFCPARREPSVRGRACLVLGNGDRPYHGAFRACAGLALARECLGTRWIFSFDHERGWGHDAGRERSRLSCRGTADA